ncbi:hypothetical protein B0T26DRAFT_746901 [Lasiosphaeria miniovina]|uniref:Uncharacterized protein n=1 Tax=Lasiosphaeria miniovina TaxID=1954250 RepID=A0AA40BJ14_9PEZI|nr:uncharacterized protein B0T26DRAFT_746901 [Lasiosphaeria miniovina]KAK0735077.1 hypothetical protein B0T26DRAFT_746901 [Lasiosphaeria miniovina]
MPGPFEAPFGFDPRSAALAPVKRRPIPSSTAPGPVRGPLEADRITQAPPQGSAPSGTQHAEQASDPICERVLIKWEGNVRTSITPAWAPGRVEVLSAVSPLIRARVDDLRCRPHHRWEPVISKSDGFDADTATRVLNEIGPETANRRQTVDLLCLEANVMWFFEVVAKQLRACPTWEATDGDGGLIASKSNSRHAVRKSQASQSSRSSQWQCWYSETAHWSRLTALQLANIALVLEWDDVFKRELKTVVWDWTNASEAVLETPVERLKATGEEGLDKRREDEKGRILRYMRKYLDDQKAVSREARDCVKRVKKDLKKHNVKLETGHFEDPNIYRMLKKIDDCILKESLAPGEPAVAPQIVNRNRPATPGLLGKLKTLESGVESIFSGGPAHREFVLEMRAAVHRNIIDRQESMAQAMLAWRNGEVSKWLKH